MPSRTSLACLLVLVACAPSRRTGDGGPIDSSDAGSGSDAGTSCAQDELFCDDVCRSVRDDDEHCGACHNACDNEHVCSNGACAPIPTDCRVEGVTCPSHTWCNPVTGKCVPGCSTNADCDPSAYCDLTEHECRCDEGRLQCGSSCLECDLPANATAVCSGAACGFACRGGHHRCGDQCVSNTSIASCGQSCTPCEAPAGGVATCNGTSCGMACPSGARLCGGRCATCPTSGVDETVCNAEACEAVSCLVGYVLENGACRKAWTVQNVGFGTEGVHLAIKPDGTPVIAWSTHVTPNAVRLKQGSSSSTTVDLGRLFDLATDAQGRIHLLGFQSGGHSLRHLVAGDSSSAVVTSDGYQDPAVATLPDGSPVVFSNTGSSMYLPKIYEKTAAGWMTETLSYSLEIYEQQIAASPQGHVWGLLETLSTTYRLVRRNASSDWTLDATNSFGFNPALAVRSDGAPVVVSADGGFDFRLVIDRQETLVDTGIVEPYWTHVAMGPNDEPHVAFSSVEDGVFYAVERQGSWVLEQVSTDDTYGRPEIAVSADGVVHIAWSTHEQREIFHARRN